MHDLTELRTSRRVAFALLVLFATGCGAENGTVAELKRSGVILSYKDHDETGKFISALFSHESNCCDDLKMFGQAMRRLRDLPEIERLVIDCPKLTDDGINELAKLRGIKRIQFDFCRVTDKAFDVIENIQTLEEVYFQGCDNITGDTSFHLGRIPKLWKLELRGSMQFRLRESHLSEGAPPLVVLDLGMTHTDDDSLRAISQIPTLRELKLDRTRITNDGLKHLAQLSSLESLGVGAGVQIDDSALEHLMALKSLRTLNIMSTSISRSGRDRLVKALPNTHIKSFTSGGQPIQSEKTNEPSP